MVILLFAKFDVRSKQKCSPSFLFASDMVILLFAKFDLRPRMARVGFAWCDLEPLASCVWRSCTSDRKSGSARGNKKEPRRFCPLSARCGAWPLKKLHSDYEAGVSPQTAKSPHDLVPREPACQGESK